MLVSRISQRLTGRAFRRFVRVCACRSRRVRIGPHVCSSYRWRTICPSSGGAVQAPDDLPPGRLCDHSLRFPRLQSTEGWTKVRRPLKRRNRWPGRSVTAQPTREKRGAGELSPASSDQNEGCCNYVACRPSRPAFERSRPAGMTSAALGSSSGRVPEEGGDAGYRRLYENARLLQHRRLSVGNGNSEIPRSAILSPAGNKGVGRRRALHPPSSGSTKGRQFAPRVETRRFRCSDKVIILCISEEA